MGTIVPEDLRVQTSFFVPFTAQSSLPASSMLDFGNNLTLEGCPRGQGQDICPFQLLASRFVHLGTQQASEGVSAPRGAPGSSARANPQQQRAPSRDLCRGLWSLGPVLGPCAVPSEGQLFTEYVKFSLLCLLTGGQRLFIERTCPVYALPHVRPPEVADFPA